MLLLTLRGGHASSIGGGVGIELDGGRELLFQRLHITDSRGSVVAGELCTLNDSTIMITAYDADAVYPLTIDPTITDADWFAVNTSLPGANGCIYALATTGDGTVYVGGSFTAIGTVAANFIAKWDGSTWSPLGSGINGVVSELAVSGITVYAGGWFTTAGDRFSPYLAGVHIQEQVAVSLPGKCEPLFSGMDGRGGVIRYSLQARSSVSLRVYSLHGRLIAPVVERVQDAGYYTVDVRLPEGAKGYHVIVFRAGDYVVKRGLVELK